MPLPRYTEKQLKGEERVNGRFLNLPGFNRLWPEQFDFSLINDTDWDVVSNLTVMAWKPPYGQKTELLVPHLLTAIRKDTKEDGAAQTHANVVSTPTRIVEYDQPQKEDGVHLKTLFDGAASSINVEPLHSVAPKDSIWLMEASPNPVPVTGDSPSAYFARELLQKKFGISVGEENADAFTSVSFSGVLAGFSYVADREDGEPLYEAFLMPNFILNVREPSIFPAETARYREIGWTPYARFAENVKSGNVGALVPTALHSDMVVACVRGNCNKANVFSSANPQTLAAHLGMGPEMLGRVPALLERPSSVGQYTRLINEQPERPRALP